MHARRHTRATRTLALLFTLCLVLAACSSGDDDESEADDAARTTTTATATSAGGVDQTPPDGANGIKIDAEGKLWIAVLNGDELIRVDGQTGEILARVPTPDKSGPDDLVISDSATIYWTGFTSGDIGQVEPGSSSSRTIANVGEGANPIALRTDGILIVGRAIMATGLFSIDLADPAEPEPLGDPGSVNSFSIDPEDDEIVYAPLTSVEGGAAVAIDTDTGQIDERIADIPGLPIALRWAGGQLYVLTLDQGAKVYRVDLATGGVALFGDPELPSADNLAVGALGEVYITGFDQPTVTVLGPDGQISRTVNLGA
jgi:sugar lactone lactonase YvrE